MAVDVRERLKRFFDCGLPLIVRRVEELEKLAEPWPKVASVFVGLAL
jgi:hypothetical protein